MLILDLCNYSDAYIVVRATTDFLAAASREYDKAGNNFINAPFTSYISKINNTFTDNTEDLDIVMSMYSLLEYSGNYFMT